MNSEPQPQEIIEYSPELDRQMAQINEAVGTKQRLMVHNLPDDPGKRLTMLSKALSAGCSKIKDLRGQTFGLAHFVCHNVEIVDTKTGEVGHTVRTVLFNDEGEAFSCVSEGVFQAVQLLQNLFPDGNLPKGLTATVEEVETRAGHRIYSVVWGGM